MKAYSINDVCQMVCISRTTFYDLRRHGRAPLVTKINGRSVVFEDDLKSWRDALRKEAARQ